MKHRVIWSSIVLLLIATGITIAQAERQRWRGWCGRGWHNHAPLAYVVHELNLSDAQISQIKSLWEVERPTISAQFQEVIADGKEMATATANGNPDESRVEEIAARQGAAIAKLLVEKERLRSKIYTSVLNREQRIKADELQKQWISRLDRIADRMENVQSGK